MGGVYWTKLQLHTSQVSGREGPTLVPGRHYHCSIQLSSSTMVITGGEGSEGLVTEHSGIAAVIEEEDGLGMPAKEVMH